MIRFPSATKDSVSEPCFKSTFVGRQNGVGLIEILLSLFVIAVGFFGIANMQLRSFNVLTEAINVDTAARIASDMADRMRTNTEGIDLGYYDNIVTAAGMAGPNCSENSCSSLQISQRDLAEWSKQIFPDHLQGAGVISVFPILSGVIPTGTVTPVNNGIYEIKIQWRELVDGEEVDRQYIQLFVFEELS